MAAVHTISGASHRAGSGGDAGRPGHPLPVSLGLDADPAEPPQPQLRRATMCSFSLLIRGQGVLRDASGEHRLAPGSVILRLPDRDQELRFDEEPRYGKAFCCLPARCLSALRDLAIVDPASTTWACLDPALALRRHADLLGDLAGHQRPRGLQLWQRLLDLLQAWAPAPPVDDTLAETARLLSQDLDASWDLGALAARCGLTYDAFRRRFRQRFGVAPAAWRLQARMHEAARLLADTSVQEVADTLGYANPFAFSTQFKRSLGLAPSHWRKGSRGS